MDLDVYNGMRVAVDNSFNLLLGAEFSFLGSRRDRLLSGRAIFDELVSGIERKRGLVSANFRTFNTDASTGSSTSELVFKPESRHRTVQLAPATGTLRVAVVHGSFDPFHLGHLLSALDAVADGTCDFTVVMPNADNAEGGASLKPNKSAHAWRMRTCFEGGSDDLFPAVRLSSFGEHGDAVGAYTKLLEANRTIIDSLDALELVIIIGSDIVLREHFVEWTNANFAKISAARKDGKVRITLRVVQRLDFACSIFPGTPLTEGLSDTPEALAEYGRIVQLTEQLDCPVAITREVSCASSSSIKRDRGSEIWLYPRAVPLLEALLLYSPGRK